MTRRRGLANEFWAVQKETVHHENRADWRGFDRWVNRRVRVVIKRPAAERLAGDEWFEHPLDERVEVKGVQVKTLGRVASAAIAHGARMMKVIERAADNRPLEPARKSVRESRLAGSVDPVDREISPRS